MIRKIKIMPVEDTGLEFSFDKKTKTASVTGLNDTKAKKIIIPSQVEYDSTVYDVTKIDDSAFIFCKSFTSIEIPNSITTIELDAFMHCTNLTSIEIPNSVTTIGEWAFDGCKSLKIARVPKGCKVDEGAFPETCKIEWY